MKRILSMALSAALMLTLAAPAAAETAAEAESPAVPSESAAPDKSNTDQRLAQVTAKVKATLSIGDEYEEFYGELRENELAPVWDLNWSGDGVSLTVEATETGKILNYYLSDESNSYETPSYGSGNYVPAFPAVSREQAQKSAEAFLKKVLDPSMETARFSDRNTGRLSMSSHRFGGDILLNGVSSPLTFSMTVRSSDGKVIRFYRDNMEQNIIGGVPGSKPSVSENAAGEQLKGTMKMRLEYVLDPDAKKASLQYLPEQTDTYYVDARTGELINLTKLYEEANRKGLENGFAGDAGAAPEASMDTMASGGSGLSQAELDGISKMEGVLDKEDLDKSVRKLSALGLDKYTFGSASYSLDRETGQVIARLLYSRKDGDNIWRRTAICDGKTGALLRVYSSAPYTKDRKSSVSEDAARKTGEAFLTELWGEDFAKTALYDSTPWQEGSYSSAHDFQYAQKENGYFFPENSLRVSVDVTDCTISGLDRAWTDDVAFDSPEGILDAAAGLDAWFGHYTPALAYRNIPLKLDPSMPEAVPLLDKGYSYFYQLKLSYAAEEDKYASGVDAKTGKVIYRDIGAGSDTLSYSDTADHWAKEQIEALAAYGIGWSGGTCQPRRELTQLDLVALLASADGYRYDPETDKADDLYSHAYSLGMLKRSERQDERVMTRGETVRMLLDGAGFGPVARLQGIFTCSYADRDQIPAELLSWAALAQGLGMVSAEGNFAADRAATRAEAAVMLYQLMSR